MSKQASGFEPIRLEPLPNVEFGPSRVNATVILKGDVADEFEKMREEFGLNRSQLLLQMVYHCLNKTKDLKDFYRRLALLR